MFDGLFVVLVVAALVPLRWASSRRSRSPGPLPRPGAGDGAGHCDRTVCARLGASSLLATSLVLVLPLLADAGQLDTAAGRLVVAGSSLGELTAVVLLSLLFSVKAAPIGGKLILFALLLILAALATIGLARADEPAADKHPQFHVKLSGLGYGFLIPVFFVNSGVTFDLRALTSHPATLARVPVFLAALLLVRGLPAALVYARLAVPRGRGRRAAAVDVTTADRGGHPSRSAARPDPPGQRRRAGGSGPAVGRPVPRARPQAARR
jgi:Kef-type K+ transport system membrane component KefB